MNPLFWERPRTRLLRPEHARVDNTRVVQVLTESITVCLRTARQTHDRKLLALLFARLADGLLDLAVGNGDLAGLLLDLQDAEACTRMSRSNGELSSVVATRVLELGGPGRQAAPVEALLAYPLLAPYLRALECKALLELPFKSPDLEVGPNGALRKAHRWPARGLLWDALRRLRGAWLACFPDADPCAAVFPTEALRADEVAFLEEWQRSAGPQWQRHLAREATALGFYRHWLEKQRTHMGWKARLKFWQRTPDRAREKVLQALKQRAHNAAMDAWQGLLEAVRRVALGVPGPAIFLALGRFSRHLDEIGINSLGQVAHREQAHGSLTELEERFRRFYVFPESFTGLLRGVQSPCDTMTSYLHDQLARHGKLKLVSDYLTVQSQHTRTLNDQKALSGTLPLYDRVNGMKSTPEKRLNSFFKVRVGRLERESEELLEELLAALWHVAPPLALYLQLPGLARWMDEIEVEREYHWDSQSGERSTRYRLVNKDRAVAALVTFNRQFEQVYGTCGLCDLLETASLQA